MNRRNRNESSELPWGTAEDNLVPVVDNKNNHVEGSLRLEGIRMSKETSLSDRQEAFVHQEKAMEGQLKVQDETGIDVTHHHAVSSGQLQKF